MLAAIDNDLALLAHVAGWIERASADGKRLKPREVVAEFDKYLHDELDLLREASNAAQLRRNMHSLNLVMIPEMYWDYCMPNVMVMQRMQPEMKRLQEQHKNDKAKQAEAMLGSQQAQGEAQGARRIDDRRDSLLGGEGRHKAEHLRRDISELSQLKLFQ